MSDVTSLKIITKATDPIYIGTGGYSIGRVDNTIVRDPISRIPKIPGTSLAGTWRYYMALQLQSYFKENDETKYRSIRNNRKGKEIEELFLDKPPDWVTNYDGNRYAALKCAGQDELPNLTSETMKEYTSDAHCGHCIVCKSFGYSKKDKSEQGLISFTDLNILYFPVYTRLGARWITSKSILQEAGFKITLSTENEEVIYFDDEDKNGEYLNLGWLNLPMKHNKYSDLIIPEYCSLEKNQIVIVPDNLISQIINSNLEVRTSVSIDPNTGAAKEGALFTSEAIPRSTIFYGNIHIFDRAGVEMHATDIKQALIESKHYYETLGIGGMTTRGFGRIVVLFRNKEQK